MSQLFEFPMSVGPKFRGSSLAVALGAFLVLMLSTAFSLSVEEAKLPGLVINGLVFLILLVGFGYCGLGRPRAVIVSGDGIRVLLGKESKLVASSSDIESVESRTLNSVLRVNGVGGFMGSWGTHQSKELSSFEGYLTRADHYVVITKKSGKSVVVTPDEPQALIEECRKLLPAQG